MTFRLLRLIAILAAYAFGLTSLTIYYNSQHADLLLVTIIVMLLAHLMVAIGTINTTLDLASGKRKNSESTHSAEQPVKWLWWQAIKRSWPWHAALIIPKMGLSLAFVQYLHTIYWTSTGAENWNLWGSSFLHQITLLQSYLYFSYSHPGFATLAFSQWETVLIGLLVIVLYALAEVGLLSSIALIFMRSKAMRMTKIAMTLTLRYSVFGLILFGIVVSVPFFYTYSNLNTRSCWLSAYHLDPDMDYWGQARENCVRLAETLYTGGLSLGGQGTLLAANIMRPVGEGTYFAKPYDSVTERLTEHDNRPFVLRQMVAAALGLGLYAALTWGALRIAQRRQRSIKNPSG